MFKLTYSFDKYHYDLCEPAFQYDIGQKLRINNLPSDCEAHWVYDALPLDVEVDIRQFKDNVCKIPDLAFSTASMATCYLFQKKDSRFETIAEIHLNVQPRSKPDNYVLNDDVMRLEDLIESIVKKLIDAGIEGNDIIKDLEEMRGIFTKNGNGDLFLADDGIYKDTSCDDLTNAQILEIWNNCME